MVSVIQDTTCMMLMYTGLQHPMSSYEGSRLPTFQVIAPSSGLDVPFTTRVTRHMYRRWTDKKPVIKSATRFVATHLDADVLQIRSMGTS